jgi:hypothetical protein
MRQQPGFLSSWRKPPTVSRSANRPSLIRRRVTKNRLSCCDYDFDSSTEIGSQSSAGGSARQARPRSTRICEGDQDHRDARPRLRRNRSPSTCAEKPVFRQLRFTHRVTVSKQEEQVRHIFGINKASPSNSQQGESQSQECKRQHDSEVATGFSGKICCSVHHFLRFSARENETDGFATGGLNTVDAPGMCEWFHTPEKFCEIDRNRSPPRGGRRAERKLYTGIRSACCADSPRGTVELRNWLKGPLATRGSPLDHFDAVLATASSMHALTCEYLIMDGSRHRKSALTDVGR